MTLFHFSDDPSIQRFEPRVLESRPREPALVWAIDAEHAPLYFFPRECPRIAFWALPASRPEDVQTFLGHTAARWVIAIESGWLGRLRAARIYRYRLPAQSFTPQGEGGGPGYYVSSQPVTPLGVEPLGDLLERLMEAGIELRITPSFWPLWKAVMASSLHWSGVRLRNAARESTP